MANIRIRFIFDSPNTLVNRVGHYKDRYWQINGMQFRLSFIFDLRFSPWTLIIIIHLLLCILYNYIDYVTASSSEITTEVSKAGNKTLYDH